MASAAEQLASNLNFSTFAKAEDLKKRLWFTLAALLVYRLGTHIPLPGLSPEAYAQAFRGQAYCGETAQDGFEDNFRLKPYKGRSDAEMDA